MIKVIAAGTSFTFGSALHFYERAKNNKELTFLDLEPIEYETNVKNSYSSLLAKKFDGESVILGTSGYYNSFLDSIAEIKTLLETNSNVKIVLFQLINPERDFFIYNDVIYYLDVTNYNSFVESKNKLISTLDDSIDKIDFVEKLDRDIELYTYNEPQWRINHTEYFIDKLNELNEYLINKGIILQILSYYNSYDSRILKFPKNSFVIINHNGIRYSNIFNFVNNTKLRICDDIKITDDQHPNYEAHRIVAESVYQNTLKHPLYSTI
jgi:hypothetical protein